jgi:putative addiction module component (TIGR02574 family)
MSTDALGLDFVVEQALKLPVPERVEVLHRVWDSLPSDSGSIFFSAELCAELDRRIAIEDASPDDEFTWDEVKAGVPRKP